MSKMNPVVHFEMPTEDQNRIAMFYTAVFGWKTMKLGAEMGDYVLVTTTEYDEIVKAALDSKGGFTWVLAALKALLEHNIELNAIADAFPKGLRDH
ncbi:MAG: hypothetical protein HY730_05405 [Candidatus Tectomicrobia bacterium]|uniref:Glyoxalase/Bleomycin resistance-like N-terminal domain-containing protein n=1 Tax=Tectimicrobiota bacterium TaxID=2528274 RepID=A0A933LQY1_UNCTE|nr:hypothetical protein [Candidatus Tectomicrobia bacterium]